jgi:hypothetical protein
MTKFSAVQFQTTSGSVKQFQWNGDAPQICSQDYLQAVAEGDIANHTPFAKLGYNGNVGATEEDIITQSNVYPWISASGGVALEVVSTSGSDILTGTGVQKVRVGYLSPNYSSASLIINMNGASPVALSDPAVLRVNSIRATQVGTLGIATGDITCRLVASPYTVYRQIVTGFTRGRGATYTVPLGKTLYLTSILVSSGHTTVGKIVRWIARAQVDDSEPTVRLNFFQPFFECLTQDSTVYRDFEMPIRIPATADIKISATSDGAGSICICTLRGWLE